MRAGIRREAADPRIRALAADATRGCGPLDVECRARGIVGFVRRVMQYTPDPVGVEAVALASSHAANVLSRGYTWGDCDDATVFIGTLARSVGVSVRIVVASFRPTRQLHHVFPELLVAGQWADADIFRSERFEGVASRIARVHV